MLAEHEAEKTKKDAKYKSEKKAMEEKLVEK